MAQFKSNTEENYENENPSKRFCSRSNNSSLCDADFLVLLADFLFADDDEINGQNLETAENALVLDMMASLEQEINSCHKRNSTSASLGTELGYSICSHNSADNPSSSSIDRERPDLSCEMHSDTSSVNFEYLLRATDEELGIPSTSLSDRRNSDHESIFISHASENVIWNGFMVENSSAESGL